MHSRVVLIAAITLVACGSPVAKNTVGPAGGLVAAADDGLTLVLWPGALGELVEFTIAPATDTPESFGPAYEITPNPENLGVAVEVILRGELPDPSKLARVGAIDDADGMTWSALPLDNSGINVNDDTVRGHDDRIARFYALLDEGGDAGTTTEMPTSTETTDSGDPTGPPRSYSADVQPIFDANCTNPAGCHGQSPSGGLSLDMDGYENLVGVPATINGSMTRVVPGDPDGSLLMNKVDYDVDPPTQGNPMPLGGMRPPEELDVIRQWIDQGCPP